MTGLLDAAVASEVVARLGIGQLTIDTAGVAALYEAWCQHVPFDNLTKLIALRDSVHPLPGDTADDFFSSWLRHGTGGTCWSSSNALTVLATHLGFEAARVMGAMLDLPEPNHGTTVIDADEVVWLLDSSLLTGDPLQVGALPSATSRHGYRSRLAPDGQTWIMHTDSARGFELPCRLFPGVRSTAEYRDYHDRTRTHSVFNQAPYVLRHFGATVECLNDQALTIWSEEVTSTKPLGDAERHGWLRAAGFSPEILDELGL